MDIDIFPNFSRQTITSYQRKLTKWQEKLINRIATDFDFDSDLLHSHVNKSIKNPSISTSQYIPRDVKIEIDKSSDSLQTKKNTFIPLLNADETFHITPPQPPQNIIITSNILKEPFQSQPPINTYNTDTESELPPKLIINKKPARKSKKN